MGIYTRVCMHVYVSVYTCVYIKTAGFRLLFNFQITCVSTDAFGDPIRPRGTIHGCPKLELASRSLCCGTTECTCQEKAAGDKGQSIWWHTSALQIRSDGKETRWSSQRSLYNAHCLIAQGSQNTWLPATPTQCTSCHVTLHCTIWAAQMPFSERIFQT